MSIFVDGLKGHIWEKREDGTVDMMAMSVDFHNGPRCINCGDEYCEHCVGTNVDKVRQCIPREKSKSTTDKLEEAEQKLLFLTEALKQATALVVISNMEIRMETTSRESFVEFCTRHKEIVPAFYSYLVDKGRIQNDT